MAFTIASQIKDTNKISHWPRIRSTMAQVEMQFRTVAFSPRSYDCAIDTAASQTTCTLKSGIFGTLTRPVGSLGEVAVQNVNFDAATLRLSARIAFEPRASSNENILAFAPRDIDLAVPAEVVQSSTFKCPVSRPYFVGFNASGIAQCRPISTIGCAPGEYVSSINRLTLEPVCSPAGRAIACGPNELIRSIAWNGTNAVTFVCEARPSPFTVFAFTPAPAIGASGAADADTPDPLPVHPIAAPAVYTWPTAGLPPAISCPTFTPTPPPTATPPATPTPTPTPPPTATPAPTATPPPPLVLGGRYCADTGYTPGTECSTTDAGCVAGAACSANCVSDIAIVGGQCAIFHLQCAPAGSHVALPPIDPGVCP